MRSITDFDGASRVEYDVRLMVDVYPTASKDISDAILIPPGVGREILNAFVLMTSLGYSTERQETRFGKGTRCVCNVDNFSYGDFYARYHDFKKANPRDSICNLEQYSSPSAAYLTIYRLCYGVYNDQLENCKRLLDRYEERYGLNGETP